MEGTQNFLAGLKWWNVERPAAGQLGRGRLYLGPGPHRLEIVVVDTSTPPHREELVKAWKGHQAGRAAPLLLVVLSPGEAHVCGPTGWQYELDKCDPPVYHSTDLAQLDRICRQALNALDCHSAVKLLMTFLPAWGSSTLGIVHRGFFSEHVLRDCVPRGEQWQKACRLAQPIRGKRERDLLTALGFSVKSRDRLVDILEASNRRVAVAVLLKPNETPDQNSDRFNQFSPVSYGIHVAEQENLRFVVLVQGNTLRLYPAVIGMGVGQRGRTETFVELHPDLLGDGQVGYLWMLFSAEALSPGGYVDALLEESQRFAGDLADRFRERVYREVVPRLAHGLAKVRLGGKQPNREQLAETYQMALTILFRLLFIAYAEDKDLLPYQWNPSYRKRSLKGLATELQEKVRQAGGLGRVGDIPWTPHSTALWEEVKRLFEAVEKGHSDWGVPQYDGRLFSSDPAVFPIGAEIASLSLPDPLFGPVLCHLLLIGDPEMVGPVDFRSLSVREFGTIYEGLLESELSYAEQDLVVDAKTGQYRPLKPAEIKRKLPPDVPCGEIYLHNRSGARKSTGSYYTKSPLVEHLLDEALEPALKEHLERLDDLDEDEAAEQLFDFRVADIAMGSGHFLVAAVDRIERAFARYLHNRPLPKVQVELLQLREAARAELEKVGLAELLGPKIEDNQLLRRLIARRCIYGVDLNPLAVDLARLSVWIHTFVPGLPLSFLEHHLVVGNSLTGVGTWEEVRTIAAGQDLLIDLEQLLADARQPLERLGRLADRTPADLAEARRAYAELLQASRPAQALCDLVAAARIEPQLRDKAQEYLYHWASEKNQLFDSPVHRQARKVLEPLQPLHFPVAFPEVFLRSRPGFDVILGNPPWEKPRVEEHAFWARYYPGLRGLPQWEQEKRKAILRKERPDLLKLYQEEVAAAEALRKALVAGPYPGMGTGDPDLYKAFCWRFWHLLCRERGRMGVVLPRSAWAAKGSDAFRKQVLEESPHVSLCFLVNNRQWVFPDAHPQYTIALTAIRRGTERPSLKKSEPPRVVIRGPFDSEEAFAKGRKTSSASFSPAEVKSWTESAAIPLLPTEKSLEIFALMRRHPRLDLDDRNSWRARPYRELDSRNDKDLMVFSGQVAPQGFWPVMKGESFDLWEPDRGPAFYYAWAHPEVVVPHLHNKRCRARRNPGSPFAEFDPAWFRSPDTLPCMQPRIAFRDVTNRTNQRTVIAALVPPNVFLTHKAPFLLWPRGGYSDQAYLLGILSTLVLDWYARRVVETNVTFDILGGFPIPRVGLEEGLGRRVVELAGRLAAVDNRFRSWADQVGVDCGPIDESTWWQMICELDAVVALLYGLEEEHLRHIFETFHTGWEPGEVASHRTLGDYTRRVETTLEYFRHWQKKTHPRG